jgi:hypothetical protein
MKPSQSMAVRKIPHPVSQVPLDDMTDDEFLRSLIVSKIVCRKDSGNLVAPGFQALSESWTNIYI